MLATLIRFTRPEGVETDWRMLRAALRERAVDEERAAAGLRAAAYLLHPRRGEYGGFYVWENADALEAFLVSPAYRDAVRIFGAPEILAFDVAALVERGEATTGPVLPLAP